MIRQLLVAGLCFHAGNSLGCGLDGDEVLGLDGDTSLHYRFEPEPLRVAEHFSMQFRLCRAGQVLVPDAFKFDASMPSHGHGMNYRARIKIDAAGQVEATGMLFHMPGPWQIRIDLSYDGLERQAIIDYPL